MKELATAIVITAVVALLVVIPVGLGGEDGEAPPALDLESTPVATAPGNGGGAADGGDGGGDGDVSAERGQQLTTSLGCTACHSTESEQVLAGPAWKGLFGSTEQLASGETVEVDEEYLRESIVDPNAKVVEGFLPGIMPQMYGDQLSDAELDSIVEYIKSLQ